MFGRENKFDVNRFAKSIDKCAHPMLCYTREPADVRDLKVKFRRLLWLDTCYGSCVATFSGIAQHRVRTLVNRFCKPVDIKLVFSTFKINNLFNVKDPLPDRLRTRVVYKFSCASCNACYIGETSRHFATSESTYRRTDLRTSLNIYRVQSLVASHACSADCFTVLDSATTKFQVKLKESMYIKWEKPDLNQQVKHINLTLSL